MAWLGLIGGVVIGALGWGWSGAVVLGFVGWLAGIIAGSRKQPPTGSAVPPVKVAETPAARMDRLEKSVASLEARVARLEGGATVAAALVAGAEEAARVEAQDVAPAEAGAQSLDPRLRGDDAAATVAEPTPAPEPITIPPPAPPPAKPNPIIAWFTGGNAIVRIGAVILFIGLILTLNYAREHQLIAPELRVAGVALVGIVLLVVGWRLRNSRTGYAVSLQGAGIAVLYLTIFASMRLYNLISHEAAFFLLAAMAAFSAIVAVGQNSLALAVIGAGGGFLAPILASTGGGNHVVLFGYYLVLNLGIVAIAWFKAWRVLNVVAFAFTFLIGLAWGERSYRPELFETTEPFLVAFFLLYLAVAILFARASSASSSALPAGSNGRGSRAFVDGTIVFGTPLAAFGLQAGIVNHIEYALAYSSLAAAAIYIVLATILHRRGGERFRLLAESFLALGVVFATLAIPLALDARWTSAAWALEGAAIVWIGVRQQRKLARAFGLLLQLGAGLAYLFAYSRMPPGVPLFDAPFIGALLVALAGLWTSRLLATGGERVTKREISLAPAAFVWGLAWLLFAGHHEIETFLPRVVRLNVHAAFFAATALAFTFLARWRKWPEARWPGYALLPALIVVTILEAIGVQSHPLGDYGWIAWPFAFAILAFVLHDLDSLDDRMESHPALHAGTFLLAAALGAWEMHWAAVEVTARGTAWSVASVLLFPATLVLFAVSKELDARWPLNRHVRAYRLGGVLTVLLAMGAWILYANATHDGTSSPLPYLPLLNAIDLGHGLIAICVVSAALAWRRSNLELPEGLRGRGRWIVIGALSFVWLNGVLLRSLHHWADVPYRLQPMVRSVLVQASLSIFWTVIALALMVYATRSARRVLWMIGAGLMGVVVAKLFLIDLSHIGGIERIVSFIAVGVLMLVIGYFSPMPPRKVEEKVEEVA